MKNCNKIRIFSLILVVTLCSNVFADLIVKDFNGISPQKHINKLYDQSRKEELAKNVIEYKNIEDLIHLYNPEVLSLWNEWENNKSNNDIYNDYQDAADALQGGGGDSEVADAMAKAQSTGLQIQADKNYSDSYTNFLANYATEMSLVLNTKILYFNYFKSEHALTVARESLGEAERKLASAEVAVVNGAATQIDLLTAKKAVSDAKSALTKAESSRNTALRTIHINCGKAMDGATTIMKENINYLYDIATINFEKDYQEALKNNFQYEIYKKGKENARTNEVKNELSINIEAAPTKIYNDLQKKFSDILDAVDTYNNNEMAKTLALDTYNQAKNSYANGSISKNEFATAAYNYNVASADFEASIYDINIAYITYEAAVNGLAVC